MLPAFTNNLFEGLGSDEFIASQSPLHYLHLIAMIQKPATDFIQSLVLAACSDFRQVWIIHVEHTFHGRNPLGQCFAVQGCKRSFKDLWSDQWITFHCHVQGTVEHGLESTSGCI